MNSIRELTPELFKMTAVLFNIFLKSFCICCLASAAVNDSVTFMSTLTLSFFFNLHSQKDPIHDTGKSSGASEQSSPFLILVSIKASTSLLSIHINLFNFTIELFCNVSNVLTLSLGKSPLTSHRILSLCPESGTILVEGK